MTKEQMFRLRLINGFNFAPIIADAIIDLSKDFFKNDNSRVCNGQILYLAVSDEEVPGKSTFDSKHVEVILTLDAPEDMDVYEKFGLSAYRQHIIAENNTRSQRPECAFNNQRSCKASQKQLQHNKEGHKTFPRKGSLCPPKRYCQRHWSFIP